MNERPGTKPTEFAGRVPATVVQVERADGSTYRTGLLVGDDGVVRIDKDRAHVDTPWPGSAR